MGNQQSQTDRRESASTSVEDQNADRLSQVRSGQVEISKPILLSDDEFIKLQQNELNQQNESQSRQSRSISYDKSVNRQEAMHRMRKEMTPPVTDSYSDESTMNSAQSSSISTVTQDNVSHAVNNPQKASMHDILVGIAHFSHTEGNIKSKYQTYPSKLRAKGGLKIQRPKQNDVSTDKDYKITPAMTHSNPRLLALPWTDMVDLEQKDKSTADAEKSGKSKLNEKKRSSFQPPRAANYKDDRGLDDYLKVMGGQEKKLNRKPRPQSFHALLSSSSSSRVNADANLSSSRTRPLSFQSTTTSSSSSSVSSWKQHRPEQNISGKTSSAGQSDNHNLNSNSTINRPRSPSPRHKARLEAWNRQKLRLESKIDAVALPQNMKNGKANLKKSNGNVNHQAEELSLIDRDRNVTIQVKIPKHLKANTALDSKAVLRKDASSKDVYVCLVQIVQGQSSVFDVIYQLSDLGVIAASGFNGLWSFRLHRRVFNKQSGTTLSERVLSLDDMVSERRYSQEGDDETIGSEFKLVRVHAWKSDMDQNESAYYFNRYGFTDISIIAGQNQQMVDSEMIEVKVDKR
ncbi:hypothetical protein MP228_008472 [Amoeboaphelidium protococcarum]|nr:hypothetical protein MP228_008472 [Amoeboaphelidium protococcarum]